MMKKLLLSLSSAALLVSCSSVDYAKYKMTDYYSLPKAQKGGYQGCAISGDNFVSLQNGGWATVYNLPDMSVKTPLFKLSSFNTINHANVAAFGVERVDKSDPMPVLYVSMCNRKTLNGWKDACFVERLGTDGSSELVQTIIFDDTDHLFGYALQWTIDTKRKLLVGFGNTIKNEDSNNRLRIITFKLPKLSDGKEVHLTAADALENYLIQDYCPSHPARVIGQGACIRGDYMFMPTGFGKVEWPSIVYVWDMKNKRMAYTWDLTDEVKNEFEDIDFYNGDAYIQTNGRGILKFSFEK